MFNSDIRDELTEQCEVKVNYKSKSYLKLSTLAILDVRGRKFQAQLN